MDSFRLPFDYIRKADSNSQELVDYLTNQGWKEYLKRKQDVTETLDQLAERVMR